MSAGIGRPGGRPLLVLLVIGAACTVSDSPAPPFSGPSELALRLSLQAIPDSILQDGASQAAIQVEATGVDSRPVRALPLRVDVVFRGTIQDFGTLSTKTLVTD